MMTSQNKEGKLRQPRTNDDDKDKADMATLAAATLAATTPFATIPTGARMGEFGRLSHGIMDITAVGSTVVAVKR